MWKKQVENSPCEQHGNTSPLLGQQEKQNYMNPLLVEHKPQAESENDRHKQTDCKEENREVLTEENEDDSPPGGYGWVIVLGCSLAHVIIGGFARADGVLYLKLIEKFNWSAQATAWVLSLTTAVQMLLAPLASAVTNKFSARISVFTGGILAALGVFISAFAPNLVLLYFSYGLISGTGRSLAHTPGLVTVGQYFRKKRGLAVGLSTAGTGVGMFVFPPLFEYIFQEFNYFGAFLILSAIPLNLCVVGALYRPLRLHRRIGQIQRKTTEAENAESISEREEKGCPSTLDDKSRLVQTGSEKNVSEAVSDQNKNSEDQNEVHRDENEVVNIQSETLEVEAENMMSPHDATGSVCGAERALLEANIQNPSSEVPSSTQCKRESTCWRPCMNSLKRKHEKQSDSGAKKQKPKILEVKLLKNPAFALFGISLCLFAACFKAGFTFLPAMAISNGCSETQAALLLSIAGVSDTICRIGSGIVFDLKKIQRFRPVIYNGIPFVICLVLFLCPAMSSFLGFAMMAALFGCLTGSFISQKTVILIDTLGKEKLPSSLGLLTCIQGVGMLLGPPLSGALKDVYGHYQESFYFSGGGVLLAGSIMVVSNLIRVVQRRHSTKSANKNQTS